jgi:hypothetical protein
MMPAYRKISRCAEEPVAKVMPAPRAAIEGSATGLHELVDGRVALELNGLGAGIYPNIEAARSGLAIFQRMGVAR